MIETRRGNLLAADAEALVNAVNCVGVMGAGLALQFKRAFPECFETYRVACERGEMRPGRVLVFETGTAGDPRYIINLPTKRHWRLPSRLVDVETGLAALVVVIEERGIRSVAVPALGCGLGGLDWQEVRPRIVQALGALTDVRVLLFEPSGTGHQARTSRR